MKQVTETALTYILAAHPNTRIDIRDGKKIAVIPTYDIENDVAGTIEKEVVADPEKTPMGMLPVFEVRHGAIAKPEGQVHTSPLGHLYKIIGFTPGKKDSQD